MPSANRNTLHFSKLEEFKKWCERKGIATKPGSGEYQVLQVRTGRNTWLGIYKKLSAKEHYSVDRRMNGLIKKFINDQKEAE